VYLCETFNLPKVAEYWMSVVSMNEWQKTRFARRIVSAMFDTVRGKAIAVLGYAFKKDTGDTRETPALDVVLSLVRERANVRVYDPKVPRGTATREITAALAAAGNDAAADTAEACVAEVACPYAAIAGAHAIVILTEWDEFRSLDYARALATMARPAYVFDGRRVVDAPRLEAMGFRVYVIGQTGNVVRGAVMG
jgi:UDPglucose 6-dehydrogenase